MITARQRVRHFVRQSGLTYVEVMIATAIIAVALVPAIEALHTSLLGAEVYESSTAEHYAALSKMEEVLSEPHSALIVAAAESGKAIIRSSYSDAPGTPIRNLVFLSLYDTENKDSDGNVFTVADPNLDGDDDPYTNYTGLIWVRVKVDGSITHLESLSAP